MNSKMKSVLVTGGAGFIGANFVHYVLRNELVDRLTVLDKLTYAGNLKSLAQFEDDARLSFVQGDIGDAGAVRELLGKSDFSHVAHFAAESHVDRSILGPEEFIRTNVLGTFHLLEELRRAGWQSGDGRRCLHVSTDEVYGSLGLEDSERFHENTPYQPNSPYSASKAGSDHLVRAYHHTYKLPVVTSNCSNNYGPYQFPEKLIPLMIINCLEGRELPVYGRGENVRDWLFVEDHCEALAMILADGVEGECYNVGGDSERKNIDVVRSVCAIMDELHPDGAPHERLVRFVQDRPGHDLRYAVDASKIGSRLGWKPRHRFEEALRRTVEWYLGREDWWREILSGEYRKYYSENYGAR